MAHDSYRGHLASVPLFSRCSTRQLDHVLSVADEVTVPAGTTFIREGEIGREMFVVVEGSATVTQAGTEVATLGRGDFVGELSVLRNARRNASVTAATGLDLLVVRSNVLEPLLDDIPGLAKALLLDVVDRLDRAEQGLAS